MTWLPPACMIESSLVDLVVTIYLEPRRGVHGTLYVVFLFLVMSELSRRAT